VPTAPDGRRAIAGDDIYLPLTGGTLTGPLQLDGRPLHVNGDLTIDRTVTSGQAIGAVNFSSGAQTRAVFQVVAIDNVASAAFQWLATPIGETTPRPTMALSANGDIALTALSNNANLVAVVSYTDQLLPPSFLTLRGRGVFPGQLLPVQTGDLLGGLWCDGQFGDDPADNTDSAGASIDASATEDWSDTSTGSRWNFRGVARGQRGAQLFAVLDETGFSLPVVNSRLRFGAPTWEMGVFAGNAFGFHHPASDAVLAFEPDGLLVLTPPAGSGRAGIISSTCFSNLTIDSPGFVSVRARGTRLQPQPVLEDSLGGWWCGGQYGTANDQFTIEALIFQGVSTEPWSETNRGCAWLFYGIPNGSTVRQHNATIYGNGDIEARANGLFGGNLVVDGASINFTSAGAHTIAFPGTVNTIAFNGATTNMITWPIAGIAPPAVGPPANRSLGTKLVLYPNQVGGIPALQQCDYGLGIETGALWYAGANHHWYSANATRIMELGTNGTLTLSRLAVGNGGNLTLTGFGISYTHFAPNLIAFGWSNVTGVYGIPAYVDNTFQGWVQIGLTPFDLRDRLNALEARLAAVEARRS
jgi:hypothetical protein